MSDSEEEFVIPQSGAVTPPIVAEANRAQPAAAPRSALGITFAEEPEYDSDEDAREAEVFRAARIARENAFVHRHRLSMGRRNLLRSGATTMLPNVGLGFGQGFRRPVERECKTEEKQRFVQKPQKE